MNDRASNEQLQIEFSLMKTADAYYDAARKLSYCVDKDDEGVGLLDDSIPLYNLICHSAELYLKGAIFYRSQCEKELKEYGHNLDKLIEVADGCDDITPTDNARQFVSSLGVLHRDLILRYDFWVLDRHTDEIQWPVLKNAFEALEEFKQYSEGYYIFERYHDKKAMEARARRFFHRMEQRQITTDAGM